MVADDERRKRLRAALDGVDLTPEQTQDDKPEPEDSRDSQILREVPPHHGTK